MAEISSGSEKGKKGKTKKMSTRVDLTPMVDLGFLLITFFMLTTSLIKPQTMEIAMPPRHQDDQVEQTKIKASKAVTIILGKDNKVFYYEGTRENDIDPVVITTNFSSQGVRKLLFKKNYDILIKVRDLKQELVDKKITKEAYESKKNEIIADKSAPIVLIKSTDESSYKDLIDILDEMAICNISRYAIIDIAPYDLELIKNINI